jgi:hypothetical protein
LFFNAPRCSFVAPSLRIYTLNEQLPVVAHRFILMRFFARLEA